MTRDHRGGGFQQILADYRNCLTAGCRRQRIQRALESDLPQRGHPVAQQEDRIESLSLGYQESGDRIRSAYGGRDIIPHLRRQDRVAAD